MRDHNTAPAFHTRADELESACIRAQLYQDRGLAPATGCLLAGPRASFAQAPASAPALGAFHQDEPMKLQEQARSAAVALESHGWSGGVPRILTACADELDRIKSPINPVDPSEAGEPLAALCLEAADSIDDGHPVDGIAELLRAASLRLGRAGV